MSSETGKRNPDRLNMIGVVVVGICGAVLVYVSIALLQAFYMNDTAQVETMADYGGQDTGARSLRSQQLGNIAPTQGVRNQGKPTFVIPIDRAIELVVEAARTDASNLVPSQGPANKPTVQPIFGRPKPLGGATGAPTAPADCDEVSCVLGNYEGACCDKFRRGLPPGGVIRDGSGGAPPTGTGTGAPPAPGAGSGAR